MKTFIILGRDKRYDYLCDLLKLEGKVLKNLDKAEGKKIIIFPFTAGEKEHIKAMPMLREGDIIVVGKAKAGLWEKAKENGIRIKELLEDEDFLFQNSVSTAEGALAKIISETPRQTRGEKVLVLGFGNVGKATAKLFRACGCFVTVTSRSRGIKEAKSLDFNTISLMENNLSEYGIIINTIPATVLTAEKIASLSSDAYVMELASGSENIDMNTLALKGVNFIMAQGLPGKYTPLSEAEEMKKAIVKFLNESEWKNIEKKKTIGLALTGSYCTFEKIFEILPALCEAYNILPIISLNVFDTSTRFGSAEETMEKLEKITKNQVISTIVAAEPIGPEKLLDLLVIAPCTGNSLAKLALGITDTPVAMAYKAHKRNGGKVLIGISTNDGLSASAPNIARLLNTKGVFFIPFGQDSPTNKSTSLVSHFDLTKEAIEKTFENKQLQPLLR